jgi:hypothetical protein
MQPLSGEASRVAVPLQAADAVLVSGTVSPPPRDGTKVSVFVWPDAVARTNPEIGTTFEIPLVAEAPVTSGRFSVPMPSDLTVITQQAAANMECRTSWPQSWPVNWAARSSSAAACIQTRRRR